MNNSISYPCTLYKSKLLREEYRKYKHSSGLDIYIFPKKLTSTYALFGTKYGSIHNCFRMNDSEEAITVPDGIAHFLEHKLFAAEDGSDAFERFSEFGADANAYTSFNKTCYLFSCTDRFEESLGELLSFVTHPYFTEESVESEIGIIGEEIRMYADNPSDRCYYGMLEAMYEHHAIRRNICGSAKSIAKITPELLYRCYDAFYRLSNMALVVSGNVTDELVLAVVDRYLPRAETVLPPVLCPNENDREPPHVCLAYKEQKMQVSKPIFNIGFKDTHIPNEGQARQRKDAAMAILDEMLFSRGGELYTRLIDKELISPAFSYGYTISESTAYNSLAGEADDPRAVLREVMDYLGSLRVEDLSYEDFLRGKRVMYAEFVKAFDSTDNIANNLFSFICEDSELLSYAELLEEITFEEVVSLFSTAFREECVTLSVVSPLSTEKNN